jgi:hypothetical protein
MKFLPPGTRGIAGESKHGNILRESGQWRANPNVKDK